MATWLVTGGAGFIGSNFVRHCLRHTDARLVVLDKLTYAGSLENLPGPSEPSRMVFVEGDIADPQAVESVFREHHPTAVINFAAETHVDRSIEGPGAFVQTNVVGTYQLLENARRHLAGLGPSARERFRFLQISTDEVYGTLGATGVFTETTSYAPNSPYAASKAAADHLVRAYQNTYGLPTLVTHCSNNYGPYQFPEKLVPLMILNALEGKPLPLYGDGKHVREWIYVEDHCEGILQVLLRGEVGERYNIGGGEERTNVEIVDLICDLLEEAVPAAENPAMRARRLGSYRDLKTFVADRRGHDRRYALDSRKIRESLSWEPRHDLRAGLRRTVDWYLENRRWCEAVQETSRYRRERLGLVG